MTATAPLCDAHCHLFDLMAFQPDALETVSRRRILCVSSCHNRQEWQAHIVWITANPTLAEYVATSFGIHPQNPVWEERSFLEELIGRPAGTLPRLAAIGECGFDFFTGRAPDGPHGQDIQAAVFEFQLDLAEQAGLPLVIHLRRGTELMLRYASRLAKLPAVIFHSWPSPPEEAAAFLRRGVNAYFSLGTPLLQGKKSALRSLVELPLEQLLLESDAPYQSLKDRSFTDLTDLEAVYEFAAARRSLNLTEFAVAVAANFRRAYAQLEAI